MQNHCMLLTRELVSHARSMLKTVMLTNSEATLVQIPVPIVKPKYIKQWADLPDATNLLSTASMLHSYCTINCANYWVTVASSKEEMMFPLIATPGGMSFYIVWSTYLLTVLLVAKALWISYVTSFRYWLSCRGGKKEGPKPHSV